MKDEEIAASRLLSGAKVLHILTVFGSVVLAYNLPDVSELKLDSDTLAGIFLGEITNWNDAKLGALNSGVSLPDEAIQVVHRSDSSGTTSIFTSYLTSVNQGWADAVGAGKEVQWPVGVGGQVRRRLPSSSSRIRSARTLLRHRIQATMVSPRTAGNFIAQLESTSAAAAGAQFEDSARSPTAPTPTLIPS
jgi:phosphate transport system substrate-binding protein